MELPISAASLPPLLAALLTIAAGGLVLRYGRPRALGLPFFAGALSVSIWLAGYVGVYGTNAPEVALAWARRAYFGVLFMAPTLLHFVVVFLGRRNLRRVVIASYAGAAALVPISQGEHFLYGVQHYSWGWYPRAHELYWLFLAYFYTVTTFALGLLVLALRRGNGSPRRRAQTWYLLLAFGVAVTGTIDYLPKFGVEVYPFGYVSILLYNAITAYAIIRHRLMDLEVLVRRSVVFAALVAVVLGLVVVGATLVQGLVTRGVDVPAWAGHLFAATIIAFTHRRIDAAMSSITERFLFQKKQDYAQQLRVFSERVATELDLGRLAAQTMAQLRGMFWPRGVVLAAPSFEHGRLRIVSSTDAEIGSEEIPLDDELALALREPIGECDDAVRRRGLERCVIGGFVPAISVPLRVHGEPYGLLLLGPKRADTTYTTEELDVLRVLSQTLAISLHNAHQATALTEALGRAQDAAKAKSEFVASVSHELRTPLNSIVNLPEALLEELVPRMRAHCDACSSEFALEPGETVAPAQRCPECDALALTTREQLEYVGEPESTARHLRTVVGAGRHLLAVVDDLLDFSRAEAGKLEIRKRATALAEIVAAVRDATQGAAAARGSTLQFDVAVEHVLADPLRLTQVLVNLVGNALRFSPEGSPIVVRGRAHAGGCELAVIDRGIGIAESDRELVFESFRQVHGGNTKKVGGTGLGLAIVKRFVDAMGGTIGIESEIGRGSTFIVWLPGPDEGSGSDEEDRAA